MGGAEEAVSAADAFLHAAITFRNHCVDRVRSSDWKAMELFEGSLLLQRVAKKGNMLKSCWRSYTQLYRGS